MYFFLTIDVEEDNQWSDAKTITMRNVDKLPEFQDLCNNYGVKPTYLVTYGVSQDLNCQRILGELQARGDCEIGGHLHPWTTPPYEMPFTKMAYPHTYPSELPSDLLERKLITLTNSIKVIRGEVPKSYRAGRYGINETGIAILKDLGYVVDSSVTPLYSWGAHKGTRICGPDFTTAPFHPYWVDSKNILDECQDKNNILEVPITIRKIRDEYYWLRPFPQYSSQNLINLCEFVLENEKNIFLNMMFHSSELSVGCSPYIGNSEDLDYFMGKLKNVFELISDKGLSCITLSNFKKLFSMTSEIPSGHGS